MPVPMNPIRQLGNNFIYMVTRSLSYLIILMSLESCSTSLASQKNQHNCDWTVFCPLSIFQIVGTYKDPPTELSPFQLTINKDSTFLIRQSYDMAPEIFFTTGKCLIINDTLKLLPQLFWADGHEKLTIDEKHKNYFDKINKPGLLIRNVNDKIYLLHWWQLDNFCKSINNGSSLEDYLSIKNVL